MRVLVTGSAGHVGAAAVRHLADRGHEVRGIDVVEPEASPVEFALCDVANDEALAGQLRDIDAVLHLAAIPVPRLGTPQAIFDLNCAGTVHLFQVCVDAGVRRVVVASSINAIGYLFGTVPFELDYLPVDEKHPRFPSDAYSFSKQMTEEIGAYYWRREGISNTCLRFGAGLRSLDQMRARAEQFAEAREIVAALAALTVDERRAEVTRIRTAYDAARRQRAFEQGSDWEGLTPAEQRLMTMRHNLFSYVDLGDACHGMECCLVARYEGSHPLFIVDRHNTLCVEAAQLAEIFYPTVKRRAPLRDDQSLVDWRRAEELVGFAAEVPASAIYT